MNILGDNSITMDDIPVDDPTALMDPADNENDNLGLGVNAFFNKQKGGKKLRNKIKKIMQAQKTKLGSDLQNVKK
jgi:Tfp pilus assembly protein PilZ